MSVKKDNIQGDTFSRGFPKFDETFYFFNITTNKVNGKQFHQLLPDVVNHQMVSDLKKKKKAISTLQMVLDDWEDIKADKNEKESKAKKTGVPLDPDFRANPLSKSNALIAFSMTGLDKVSAVVIVVLTSYMLI